MLDIVNKIIEMSVQASFVICIILFVRFLFLKINIPKRMIYFLWAIPLFRMVCPVTIATKYSLMPADLSSISNDMNTPLSDVHLSPALNTVTVSQEARSIGELASQAEQPSVVVEENGFSLISWLTGIVKDIANMKWEPIDVFFVVWIVGICALVAYSIISTLRLRKKLVGSVWVNNNYYRADYIDTPFVMGLIRPKIYLPSSLSEEDMDMIIKHEEMHLRRKDHIAKIIVFAVTCVHWFNPWAWVLFVLFCRDMESAVDEKVISKFDVKERQSYATLLLALSTGHRHLLSAPLAFGEGDVKGRIKNVVKYKKPVTILVVVAAIVAVVLAVGLMTSQNYLIPKNADAHVAYVNYGEILDAQELLVSEEEEEALVTALRDCKIEWTYKTYMEGLDEEFYDMLLFIDDDVLRICLDDNNAYLSKNNIRYTIDSHGPVYSILEKIRTIDGLYGMDQRDYVNTIEDIGRFACDFINDFTGAIYREENADFHNYINPSSVPNLLEYTRELRKYTSRQVAVGASLIYYGEDNTFNDVDVESLGSLLYLVTLQYENQGSGTSAQVLVRYGTEGPWVFNYCFEGKDSVDIIAAGTAEERDITNAEKWKDSEWTAQVMQNLQAYGNELASAISNAGESYYVGPLQDYYQNDDGTWSAAGRTYNYRLVLSGVMNNAAKGTVYTVLSNDPNITFEETVWASGISSNMDDSFSPEYAMIVDWQSYDLPTAVGLPIYEYSGGDSLEAAICDYMIARDLESDSSHDVTRIPAPVILKIDNSDLMNIKVWGNFWSYTYTLEGTTLMTEGGGEQPGIMHLSATDIGYVVTGFEGVRDGAGYDDDLKALCRGHLGLYQKFMNVSDEERKEIRTDFIKDYVEYNQLDIDSYQDFGWDPVYLD